MPELVANCPRCGAKQHTFAVKYTLFVGARYKWQHWYEAFSICGNCSRSTVFLLAQSTRCDDIHMFDQSSPMDVKKSLNNYFDVDSYINLKDRASVAPPEYVPDDILKIFREASTCVTVQCWNAAGCMFRTCLDLATRPLLPADETPGLNNKTRRDLGLRLPWLIDAKILPESLRELSKCVREDGNDGAHAGTLVKDDAEDLLDFTSALLERIYTEPERLILAQKRRDARRAENKPSNL